MAFLQSVSRYYTTPVPDSSGKYVSIRKYNGGSKYYNYASVDSDTFDRIAYRVFNDSERYWEIADLNPHVPFPDEIPFNTILRIPIQ